MARGEPNRHTSKHLGAHLMWTTLAWWHLKARRDMGALKTTLELDERIDDMVNKANAEAFGIYKAVVKEQQGE